MNSDTIHSSREWISEKISYYPLDFEDVEKNLTNNAEISDYNKMATLSVDLLIYFSTRTNESDEINMRINVKTMKLAHLILSGQAWTWTVRCTARGRGGPEDV